MVTAENEIKETASTPTTTTTVFVVSKYIFMILMVAVLAFVIYSIVITKVQQIDLTSFLDFFPKKHPVSSVNEDLENTLMNLLKTFKE